MLASRFITLFGKPARIPSEIAALFASSEKGGIWLPAFTRSMFQDAAMSVPAVVGMPVIKMLDLSGNGNTITFANVTLQQDAAGLKYLAANGSSSNGVTGAIDFTGTNKMTVCAAVGKNNDTGLGIVCELSASVTANNGSFYIVAPNGASHDYGAAMKGTTAVGVASAASFTAPITNVLTATGDIAGPSTVIRVNGGVSNSSVSTLGTGNFSNSPLYFFARGGTSLFANIKFYGAAARGAASSAAQLATLEAYLNKLSGAY